MSSLSPSRPTIRDVARVCDVSVATVSYVISGTRVLKQETRDRVLKAMEEMDYHPNAVARGLVSKKVHTLGVHCSVVSADQVLTNPYASGILGGILKRAQQEGFDVTIFTNRWRDMRSSAPALRDGRTDGLIVLAPALDCDMLPGLAKLGMPIVGIAAQEQRDVITVDVDNYAGARLAATHLIELGHRRIAAILGNDDLASFAPRRQGFVDALGAANIPLDPAWLMTSRFDGSLAPDQTRGLLRGQQRPTAICAGNDTIAIAVIETALAQGIRVPAQLSVVGFDDLPMASIIQPNLTTVRQPTTEIGARAASLLIERLREKTNSGAQAQLLRPELIVRDSTARVAASE